MMFGVTTLIALSLVASPEPTAPLQHDAWLVGGQWVAAQAQTAADGRHFAPVLEHRWMYPGRTMRAVMTYRFEDGEQRKAFEAISTWDPAQKKLVHYNSGSTRPASKSTN